MSLWLNLLVALVALVSGLYQLYNPALRLAGLGRVVESIGTENCHIFKEFTACEKIIFHPETSTLYAACSSIEGRQAWVPELGIFNASARPGTDYVATLKYNAVNPAKSVIQKLTVQGYDSTQLALLGMDLHSQSDGMYLYLISHSVPEVSHPQEANSKVEVFRVAPRSSTMEYLYSFEDPLISTPNDLNVAEGNSGFWVSNFHGPHKQMTLVKKLNIDTFFAPNLVKQGNIAYCSIESKKCHLVADHISLPNGIVKNGSQIFVASSGLSQVLVYDIDFENHLSEVATIQLDRTPDNLSLDQEGNVWVAAFPRAMDLVNMPSNPTALYPSSALKISKVDSEWVIAKMFEDTGSIASASTTAAFDPHTKILYLTSVMASHLTVCQL